MDPTNEMIIKSLKQDLETLRREYRDLDTKYSESTQDYLKLRAYIEELEGEKAVSLVYSRRNGVDDFRQCRECGCYEFIRSNGEFVCKDCNEPTFIRIPPPDQIPPSERKEQDDG